MSTMAGPGTRSDPQVARMVHTVILPGFRGTTVPTWLARAIEKGVGAVLYFAGNLTADPAHLSDRLHGLRPDLLIASDEEGGTVTRLHAGTGSPYPGHKELGAGGDTRRTREVAHAMGRDLRAAGIDAALAPVMDVNVDSANPVIGPRAFGDDPVLVAEHGTAFITGLRAAGLATAAKHFPGHGDTSVDSHVALPIVDVDMVTLHQRELVPFAAAVAADADMVLAGHIVVPALDDAPASVSPRAYALLRGELGFRGVAVTDALDMRGLARHTGAKTGPTAIARGAVAALAAGADLLCLGNPYTAGHDDSAVFGAVRDRLLEAVSSGTVPVGRLAEAAERVDRLLTRHKRTLDQ